MPTKTASFAAQTATSPLAPFTIDRRDPLPGDVAIDILYCGVCHSDLHTARGEWPGVVFPVVPGHEIIGRVTKVGKDVTKFKVGDFAAVGCLVDSCRTCSSCKIGLEQYCQPGFTLTYNSPDVHSPVPGTMTYGGYSKHIVVDQRFVLKVPAAFSAPAKLAAAAPLLCAGITTYSPLRHWVCEDGNAEAGGVENKKVGIVGLGGLGHMGVKFAHAFGCHTVLFTTSPGKIADGQRLGADEVVISKDANAMAKHAGSFDFILNTVAASHDLDAFTALLRRDATLCLVGAPATPHPSPGIWNLIMGRRSIAGSAIGGLPETQEMLDFCADEGILCDIEMIAMNQINAAYERMLRSDVKYRFVIDVGGM
jgi:uncharacterized zinc-type alcohol dehydrogenase-like protein